MTNPTLFLAFTIGTYLLTTVVTATAVGDFLPEDAWERRFSVFAIWAVIIGFLASGYVDSILKSCR